MVGLVLFFYFFVGLVLTLILEQEEINKKNTHFNFTELVLLIHFGGAYFFTIFKIVEKIKGMLKNNKKNLNNQGENE